ncbi:undecaprenyl-diphosphate phosphatase [Metabacillus sediminilitoris]|jgi:undecaprenyl-diphosphatase|uniref:Undecaprenyl-diphosphatase n=1 Tax=Metabacillus sediminilitoris TaxID=2567941 RepID=A0A4S4C1D7_9BACI|nr:undecaprenyl-diphosphate phosphatase [Metabacillus sediminilitoris]QGQ47998.1 undecaprenyl-diphosphate phosphatase [Metabacillus sediminilitoris]THF80890.1 undecaprenyl-diphosphate phosphatase [Metabacillus sediminilitoris]
MDFLMLIKAIILGLVEGLTEFAPVSSTGHMIIVDDVWLQSEEFLGKYVANTFKIVIQLGSILAVVVVFRNRFIDLLGLGRLNKKSVSATNNRLKLSQVIVGLIPAGILGVLFEDYIDEHLFSIETVLIGLVVGAILMIIADVFGPKQPKTETVDQITYKQAFTVGLIQCLSLWPGFSRSGSTISGGVLVGMSHRTASDFTFIMAVPIMAGASFISLLKNWEYFTLDAMPFFIAGFISAFVFALLSIRFFLKLINKIKLVPFAIYRILLVVVIYIVYF